MLDLTKTLAVLIAGLCAALAWAAWSMPLADEFIPNLLVLVLRGGTLMMPLVCLAVLSPPTISQRFNFKKPLSTAPGLSASQRH